MKTYHRYTNSNSPMSDWGHAMFAYGDEHRTDNYGANHYTYDGTDGVNIQDIEQAIKDAWAECQETGHFGFLPESDQDLTAEEVYQSFNPENIVDGAQGWDCDLACWFWEFVAEPNDIMAVITQDGAILFDEALIAKA